MSKENDLEEKLIHNTYLNGLSNSHSTKGINKSFDESKRLITPNSSNNNKKINWADSNNINRKDLLCSTNLTKELFYQKDIKPILNHKKSKPVKGILKKKIILTSQIQKSQSQLDLIDNLNTNLNSNSISKTLRPNMTSSALNNLNNSSIANANNSYNTNYSSINNNSIKTLNNFYSTAGNSSDILNNNINNNNSIVNNFINSKNLNNSALAMERDRDRERDRERERENLKQIQRTGSSLTPPNRQLQNISNQNNSNNNNINNYSSLNNNNINNKGGFNNKSNFELTANTTASSRPNNFNMNSNTNTTGIYNYISNQPNTQLRSYSLDQKNEGKNIDNFNNNINNINNPQVNSNSQLQGETKIYISPNIQSVYNNNINNYFIQSYDKKELSNNNSNNISPLNTNGISKNFSYNNNNDNLNIRSQQNNNNLQNFNNNNIRLLKNNENQRLLNNNFINSNNILE